MIDQRTAPYAALLLRLTLGTMFILHIYWKYAVKGFDAWWGGLMAGGYPTIIGIYVLIAETAAALLLIPGIKTRWVCLFAFPVMVGAVDFWARRTGFWFTVAGGELPALWGVCLLVQALLGDGAHAVKIGKRS